MIKKIIQLLSKNSYRLPEEPAILVRPIYVNIKIFILVCCLVIPILFVIPYMSREMASWNAAWPVVDLPRSQWLTYFGDSCDASDSSATSNRNAINHNCPAHPQNPLLWKSPTHFTDDNYRQQAKARIHQGFWLGIEIAPSKLQQAQAQNANVLLVGYLNSGYTVWINGVQNISGAGLGGPIVSLSLSSEQLNSKTPIKIAIFLSHSLASVFPIVLDRQGLMSWESVEAYRKYIQFVGLWRYLLVAVAHYLLVIFFGFFWLSAKKKPEYFYVAVTAAAFSLVHLHTSDLSMWINRSSLSALHFLLGYLANASLFFMALAFARIRRDFFVLGIPTLLIFLILTLATRSESSQFLFYDQLLRTYLYPLLLILGALGCFLQRYNMTLNKVMNPSRKNRLSLFGALCLLNGAYIFINASGVLSDFDMVFADKFIQLLLIAGLGAIVMLDYRDQEVRIQKYVWSHYFNSPIQQKVSGVLLRLDVIASQLLPTGQREDSQYHQVMADIRFQLSLSVRELGGVIIKNEADEMISVFDEKKLRHPEASAFLCAQVMVKEAFLLSQELKIARRIHPNRSVCLRMALVKGSIATHPEVGADGKIYPNWLDLDHQPLVTSVRILGIDKEQIVLTNSSLIVVEQHLAFQLEEAGCLQPHSWSHREFLFSAKHENPYRVSIMLIHEPTGFSESA